MQRLRSVLVFLFVLLLGGLALNCSSGGTVPFPGGTVGGGGATGGPVAPGRAAVEGFAFAAPGSGGSLAFGKSATPPLPGLAPVAGAAVDSGFGAATATDARGYFRLNDLEPGQYRLRFRPPAGGAAETVLPVTLFDGAVVNVGASAVTREAAADLVRTRLLGGTATAGSYALYAPRQPLPAGTVVAPALGNERAERDPALEYRPPADAWLFYADLTPAARFQHRVRYYFVDAATGQVTEREATSWPAINGRFYYFDEPDGSDDLVDAPADARALQRAASPPGRAALSPAFGPPLPPARRAALAMAHTRDHVEGCTTGKVHALLILGDPRGDFTADVDQAANLLRNTVRADRVLEYRPTANRVNALTEIRNLYREIRNGLGPCDTLYILIATHGYPDGHVTIAQRAQTDDVVFPGGRNGKLTVGADLVEFFPYIDLDLGATAACHVIVEVHTCYSGKVIQDWRTEIENDRTGRYWGKKILLMAECAANEVALGRAKADGPPPGGFFGVEMQRQLSGLLGTPPQQTTPLTVSTVATAFDRAVPVVRQQTADRPNDASGLPGENPTRWLREPPPHEKCGATSVTGVQLDRDLTVNGAVVARAGQRVPLFRLEGYRESQAEVPVTEEQGCATPHLHAATPSGVTLLGPNNESLGTIPDPAPRKCGYGPLVQIPIEELFP